MTEGEWLNCRDPLPMLRFVRLRLSDRKRRLFACACCRLVWDALPADWSRQAVELGEQYADGLISEPDCERAYREAQRFLSHERGVRARLGQATAELLRPRFSPSLVAERTRTGLDAHLLPARQCDLLRDLKGKPGYRGRLHPAWGSHNGGAVERLAQGIYQDRHFDLLPILADALEEAGCDDSDLLGHCRGPGPHTRGCWVLDLWREREEW